MTERTPHLDDWSLEQLAEGTLADAELPAAMSHLEECPRCAGELEGYRALYTALAGLPRFAPSAGFADAVMSRVRVPAPAPAPGWLQRWSPKTTRGWAALVVALIAPSLPLIGLVAWVATQPGVSLGGLWQGASAGAAALGSAALGQVFDWGVRTGVFGWGHALLTRLQEIPVEALAGGLALLAVAIPLSAWSLVRLVRTPMMDASYAS